MTEVRTEGARAGKPIKGGTASWALTPTFPPTVIFPFCPAGEFGIRNIFEFQLLMYRPLYWMGRDGQVTVDYSLSLAEPPVWSADGLTVTVTVKPWLWSDGQPVSADNVMFWMHLFEVNKAKHGGYVPGYFPDNLTYYRKVAENKVSFTFDKVYSRNWVLMNQLTLITPLPRAWDRTAAGPADATHDIDDAEAVYEYLWGQSEDRENWTSNPLWRVVSGPWKLKSYTVDGHVALVPNERYSGPNRPYLAELRQIPTESDDAEYAMLQGGPTGPDAIQVGFLPFDFVTEPTGDPTNGGPHPLSASYTLTPQIVYGINYFPLNQNNPTVGPIFRQLYFRQALQSLIDQDTAIRDSYKGYGWRTNGPVPMLPDSDLISPGQRSNPYPFSIEAARRLLTANGWDLSTTPGSCVHPGTGPGQSGAGVERGQELRFNMDYAAGHPTLTRLMRKLRSDAALVGIEIILNERPGIQIAAQVAPCAPSATTPCTWQMSDWNGGWAYGPGFYPTGEFQFKTGAGVNWGSYTDPQADALIEKTVTSDSLSDLYAYQDYIAQQVPVVWMPSFPLRLLEVANNLKGVAPLNPYCALTPENWYYVAE